jgi:hypothetical protein
MPSITDLKNIKKTNKIFKKKEYRPWAGEEENKPTNKIIESKEKSSVSLDKLKNNKEIIQHEHFLEIDLEKTWRCLYGAKKTILGIILTHIEETQNEYVITNAITTNQLILDSSLPANTIKTTLQQLKQDYLIVNHETKPGKGGFARYKISKNVYEYFVAKFSSNA